MYKIKRAFPALLAALILIIAAGCAPQIREQAGTNTPNVVISPGFVVSPEAELIEPGSAKGRYMESPFELELPPGVNRLNVIGISAVEGTVEIFSMSLDSLETENPVFYRHTLAADGAQTFKEEPWLNEHMKPGNQMLVVRGGDGALYATYADFDEAYNMYAHIVVSNDDGVTGKELTGGGIEPLEMIMELAMLADGRIAAKAWSQSALTILDAEGNRLSVIETGWSIGTECGVAASGDLLAALSPDGKGVRVHDMSANTHEDWPFEFGETGASLAFSPDGALYLADATGIYRHAQGGTLWECIVDGSTATIGLPDHSMTHMGILGGEEDAVFIRIGSADGDILLRYAFDSEAAQTIAEQLNIFSLHESEAVRRAVVAFNRIRSDVKANYTVAMEMNGGGTEADYIKSLNTELLAGTGPDIILLDGLPADSYIEKGVLADLAAIVDGADAILPNVRAAYDMSGRLYGVPLAVNVPLTLSRSGSYVTLDDLEASAASLSKTTFTPKTLTALLMSFYGEEFYSVPTEAAAVELLAKVKRIADTMGVNADSPEQLNNRLGMNQGMAIEDLSGKRSDSSQIGVYIKGESDACLVNTLSMSDFMMLAGAMDQFGGELSALNGKMAPLGIVGLNSASQSADTAAQFIQTLLSEEVQDGGATQNSFPVNIAALDNLLASEVTSIGVGFGYDDDGPTFQTGWPSAAAREKLGAIIKSLNSPLKSDATLNAMIEPEMIALLEGAETPESAAAKLFSKLSAYRSE